MIVYLETNSIIAVAKGRNKNLEDLLYNPPEQVNFIIPSICLMEALVAIEREEKRSQLFYQTIEIEINEAKRNIELNNYQSFANYLEQSLIDYEQILSNFRRRFFDVLEQLKKHGLLIHPNIEMLQTTLTNPFLSKTKERRDDFILQVILDHAENKPQIPKAFFSENTKEFGKANIQQVLTDVGIIYFNKVSNLEGWLKQQ
ncbi:PIN domain-containing protein [Nodularia sp. NIES-3585]|uniref:PIN domain-containing protein n=1 Tax=Nodularia sp. NIES-3585 TaxID=1973477 RepID=UPI000B5C2E13|nr:PIN domain-containing protein [Nodularia sp. NIES-3585]GAX34778.1 hypothetical protein NIES3585_07800 [Nodularia sp. NIES-3585]